jgi:catechol 2,3-dioxygenase-like lactoylglutathione lyase family enzyme
VTPTSDANAGSMLDHVILNVADYEAARRFYTGALAPLGWEVVMDFEGEGTPGTGFGYDRKPYLWIAARGEPSAPVHVALASPDRATVDAFHAAAIAAGGIDNGPPGIRAQYHPNYYGAFALDPDGNNIEAVCHLPAG